MIAKLDRKIRQVLEPYDNAVELLKEIPGLSDKAAEDLIAEIGLDMDVFPSEKHLCSWVGVSPGNNESAGKKSGRTTRGNKQAKSTLTQAAWAASHAKGTFYKAVTIAWPRGGARKAAVMAVAHSILKSAYHVLKYNVPYKELGENHLKSQVEKKRKKYLTSELNKLGYLVMLNPKPVS